MTQKLLSLNDTEFVLKHFNDKGDVPITLYNHGFSGTGSWAETFTKKEHYINRMDPTKTRKERYELTGISFPWYEHYGKPVTTSPTACTDAALEIKWENTGLLEKCSGCKQELIRLLESGSLEIESRREKLEKVSTEINYYELIQSSCLAVITRIYNELQYPMPDIRLLCYEFCRFVINNYTTYCVSECFYTIDDEAKMCMDFAQSYLHAHGH